MIRKLATILVLAALAPAAALAADAKPAPKQNPAKQCQAERTALGTDAFTLLYGGQANAFGKCVSKHAQEHAQNEAENDGDTAATNAADLQDEQIRVSAATQCKTELTADAKAFQTKYGKNASKANAFGKCVSTKSKAKTHTPTPTP